MNPTRLLARLSSGSFNNVAFEDFVRLVEAFEFVERGGRGSHRVFIRADLPELLVLQPIKGQAKPYQLRQFLRLVRAYDLGLEDKR